MIFNFKVKDCRIFGYQNSKSIFDNTEDDVDKKQRCKVCGNIFINNCRTNGGICSFCLMNESMISTDQVKLKDYQDDYVKKTRELLSSQPTPNCGICEWNLVMVGQNQILNSYCTAQGRKVAAVCYNSDECKKLFSESKPLGGKDE